MASSGWMKGTKHGRTLVAESRCGVRYSLPAPRLDARYKFINQRVDRLRRELEDAVAAASGGVVDLHSACLIGAACDHERARQFLMNRLRELEEKGEPQPLQIVAQVMTTVSRCVDARNKAISSLGISRKDREENELASLYRDPIYPDPEDQPDHQNAGESNCEPERTGSDG